MDTSDAIIRDAMSRRDTALAEARRWDEFIQLYNELRARQPAASVASVVPAASDRATDNGGGLVPDVAATPHSNPFHAGVDNQSELAIRTAPTADPLTGPASVVSGLYGAHRGGSRHGPAIGAKVLETERVARTIIAEKGRPVPTREMLEAMEARGFGIGGAEPFATLMTRLQRAPTLENVKPHGWRLKPEPGQ